jgi:hypothetical protein
VDPEWVSAIGDLETREMLERSSPVAFACKSAGSQWREWSAADRITGARETAALEILAFDAYIDNDDRKPSNPNCLLKGDAFRIIDHELAFRIRQKLFPRPEPWKAGYLQRLTGRDGHLFGADLKVATSTSSRSGERGRTFPTTVFRNICRRSPLNGLGLGPRWMPPWPIYARSANGLETAWLNFAER